MTANSKMGSLVTGSNTLGIYKYLRLSSQKEEYNEFLTWLEGWLFVSGMRVLFQYRHVSCVLLGNCYNVILDQCFGRVGSACAA